MSRKTERIILIAIMVNLAVIGIVGYGLDRRREPIGVLFITKGGAVAFNHRLHVLHGGEGLECRGCHHETLGGRTTEMNCRGCHYYGKEPHRCVSDQTHPRCIGSKCVSCHKGKECAYCHE